MKRLEYKQEGQRPFFSFFVAARLNGKKTHPLPVYRGDFAPGSVNTSFIIYVGSSLHRSLFSSSFF